ncbi:MAG: ABC transporter permease [Anaerolineales bacterium]|nr:ABC transporter permease [Anaerolineales bacterium]
MINYIIRRLLIMPITLVGMTILIFLMLWILGPSARSALYIRDIPKNEAVMQGIITKYGLNDPIYMQYWHWLVGRPDPDNEGEVVGGILRGEFGFSRSFSRPVVELLQARFPATLELTLYAFLPIILVGVWLGVQAAVRHNQWIDQLARVFSIVGYSFPVFVLGILLMMIFYAQLRWFPVERISDSVKMVILSPDYRQYTSLITVDAILNGRLDIWWDAIRHLVLPIITLSYTSWAAFLRITRSSMLETLRQEYVTTARAKGATEKDVINKHARPNALIPVATYSGITVAYLLGGVVITETIFNYPGMGSAAANAAGSFDVVTVLAFTMVTGLILILSNLVVDILYAMLDPRIRLS